MPRALSIHIGVNNPQGECPGDLLKHSEATAWKMADIAREAGYGSILVLRGAEATCRAVDAALAAAAQTLKAGDTLFLSFSGHGTQVDDGYEDLDEHEDGKDEAWCLYDGNLLDDKLAGFWRLFAKGVRILVVAENCFAGGGLRTGGDPGPVGQSRFARHRRLGAVRDGGAEAPDDDPEMRSRNGAAADRFSRSEPQGSRFGRGESSGRADEAEVDEAEVDAEEAGDAEEDCIRTPRYDTDGIRASVLALAASCEGEHALDGMFAEHLLAVWDGGDFRGSYAKFYRELKERLLALGGPKPQILMLGVPDLAFQRLPAFRLHPRPAPTSG